MMPIPGRLLAALLAAVLPLSAAAQEAASQALEAANEVYIAGDYTAAVEAYEKLLNDYPTSAVVPNAQVQLAFSYYLTGDNQKALDTLQRLSAGPPIPAELSELAAFLEPQALSALAASMPADDPKRKTTFEEAIGKFAEFVQNYPQSSEVEAAIFGSAVASFQIGDFAAARTALENNLRRFPRSASILESQNLLALIHATEGSRMLAAEEAERDTDAAFALYANAAELLRDIIAKRTDLALVNAAQFQLGEILLNEASFAPDDRKPALLEQARQAFRGVLPKERIIALQQEKIDNLPALRREALAARNTAELRRLDRQAERDRRKLAELQARPDQTVTALQKIAETYFQEGLWDESRIILAHAEPLLTDDDDKKRNLYFLAMTYAVQNAAEPAVTRYDAFQRAHKGDPIAANLPVAMGNLFLTHPDPDQRDPERAATYFREASELYPGSPFLGLSVVNEATARAQQGDFEGALKTYRDFLATNPPPEIGAVAQLGIGNVFKDQGRWDDAIGAYRELAENFSSAPQVTEAEFWIAVGTQQKGDNEGALPLIAAFVEKYPDNALTPAALYSAAGAQLALGRNEEGISTLARIAEEFPQSQPAPFTYFQRAQLAGAAGEADEVIRLMREFIEKYPEDDKVFFAFDSIGQTETNRGHIPEAIATYESFVEQFPANPKAPEAILKTADLHRAAAERLGRYGALTPEEREQWETSINASIAAAERMVAEYPDSAELSLGLRSLLAAKNLQISAELADASAVEAYFEQLAASAPDGAGSKILFARAAFIGRDDPDRALQEMEKAYDPSLVYAPTDLDLYGIALLDHDKIDEAEAVFRKIAADYPTPEGMEAAQAPPGIQEAQAIAMFGLGRVAQEKGDVAGAGSIFEQLKTLYPWSPKVLEANYGIAASLREQGQTDEAIALLTQIIRAPNAPTELRANAMLLGGFIQKDLNQREAAIDYFIKISAFYEGVPEAASTGLWEGGQLLEQQVTELQSSNPEQAKRQRGQAIRAYQELIQKFPDSEFAPKARERLGALGVS